MIRLNPWYTFWRQVLRRDGGYYDTKPDPAVSLVIGSCLHVALTAPVVLIAFVLEGKEQAHLDLLQALLSAPIGVSIIACWYAWATRARILLDGNSAKFDRLIRAARDLSRDKQLSDDWRRRAAAIHTILTVQSSQVEKYASLGIKESIAAQAVQLEQALQVIAVQAIRGPTAFHAEVLLREIDDVIGAMVELEAA
jgi:hypothetical protein